MPPTRLRSWRRARRPGGSFPAVSWKTLAAVVVGIAVVVSIGRGGIGGSGGEDTADPTGSGGTTMAVPESQEELELVIVDGNAIRPDGAVITLNPALAQPGATVNVNGAGFDAESTVNIVLSAEGSKKGIALGSF